MFVLRLLCLLTISCLLRMPRIEAQVPTEQPELIEGPWEVATATGIDGIFFELVTSTSGTTGGEQFNWQTINIRVYHREGGKETWGYFAIEEKASPESYSLEDGHSLTLFDGERLRIHFVDVTDLKPFDLDVTFSATARAWTGTWSHFGQSSRVVLKRPQGNPDVAVSPFVGDWAGESSTKHLAPGSLHVRQSADGALSAWLDRTISGYDPGTRSMHSDRRNGEFLGVSAVTSTGFLLGTSHGGGIPAYYRGTLSEDRQLLTGSWMAEGGGGLNAPDRFRQVAESAL